MQAPALYQRLRDSGLQYGPAFQGIKRLWRGNGEALGQIESFSQISGSEANSYRFHPALLDACLQVMAATLPGQSGHTVAGDTYLPAAVAAVRVFDHPGTRLWSNATLRPGAALHANSLEGDIRIYNEAGQVVAEISGLRLARLGSDTRRTSQVDPNDWLYKLEWQPQALPQVKETGHQPGRPGSWLIFADSGGVGQALAERLQARGETCFLVFPKGALKTSEAVCEQFWIDPASPTDLRQLLQETLGPNNPPCRGILHLWSFEAVRDTQDTTLASLEEAQLLGSSNVLLLVQALAKADLPHPPRLWLVTGGAQAVGEQPVSVAQAPLWGLGRVIALEHPELRCTRIDLEPGGGMAEVQSLFKELWIEDNEDQIAFRRAMRYVPRLVRAAPVPGDASVWKPGEGALSIPATP